jgi:hypothetical protein
MFYGFFGRELVLLSYRFTGIQIFQEASSNIFTHHFFSNSANKSREHITAGEKRVC